MYLFQRMGLKTRPVRQRGEGFPESNMSNLGGQKGYTVPVLRMFPILPVFQRSGDFAQRGKNFIWCLRSRSLDSKAVTCGARLQPAPVSRSGLDMPLPSISAKLFGHCSS